MRFLIIDTHYPSFVEQVYATHEGLSQRPYLEQLDTLYATGFGRADWLPKNLRKLGFEAEQIVFNVIPAQEMWAVENCIRKNCTRAGHLLAVVSNRFRRYLGLKHRELHSWMLNVLREQVRLFKPDVIFNCDLNSFAADFLKSLKPPNGRLIGECAYPIPDGIDLTPYDLVVSCVPNFVEPFKNSGCRSKLLRAGFETTILEKIHDDGFQAGVAFIGSISSSHQKRVEFLESIARSVPELECWTEANHAPPSLRGRCRSSLWGYAMYNQMNRSQIALNMHVDVAENFAGNMRMFEATGVGTLLVTDWKDNLTDLFEPGKEVCAYRSSGECVELIQHYLVNNEERSRIAKAGQERTLREHTCFHRMEQLAEFAHELFLH